MEKKSLISTLLSLRLTYYRVSILERLWRFKLLMFFVLAMVVPTVAFMLQVVQAASTGLMNGAYLVGLLIFQLLAMIWVGSQYDCLKLNDVEDYLKTLNVSDAEFFVIELLFCLVVNLPFIAFLMVGFFSLIGKSFLLLSLAHFIYLLTTLLYLSVCLIYSRGFLVILLVLMNLIFVYFEGVISCLLLSLFLGAVSYFIVIKRQYLPLQIGILNPMAKLNLSRFFPNVYLNLKSLFVWNKIYTACVLGVNLLIIFILVSYTLAEGEIIHSKISFLLAIVSIMFFCSLLTYKLSETRRYYGAYFSVFYNKFHYYWFDLGAIYPIVFLHFVVMILVGSYLGFNILMMLKAMIIALVSILIFISLNRRFSFHGPVLSLLSLASILIISRGLV